MYSTTHKCRCRCTDGSLVTTGLAAVGGWMPDAQKTRLAKVAPHWLMPLDACTVDGCLDSVCQITRPADVKVKRQALSSRPVAWGGQGCERRFSAFVPWKQYGSKVEAKIAAAAAARLGQLLCCLINAAVSESYAVRCDVHS